MVSSCNANSNKRYAHEEAFVRFPLELGMSILGLVPVSTPHGSGLLHLANSVCLYLKTCPAVSVV